MTFPPAAPQARRPSSKASNTSQLVHCPPVEQRGEKRNTAARGRRRLLYGRCFAAANPSYTTPRWPGRRRSKLRSSSSSGACAQSSLYGALWARDLILLLSQRPPGQGLRLRARLPVGAGALEAFFLGARRRADEPAGRPDDCESAEPRPLLAPRTLSLPPPPPPARRASCARTRGRSRRRRWTT